MAVAGPGAGKKCIFPFMTRTTVHYACTRQGGHMPWCGTKPEENGGDIYHWGDCSNNCPVEHNDLADHIMKLYKERKQDSIFFASTKIKLQWFDYLVALEQSIFWTDCPIFMPMKYSNGFVSQKLDQNIIFYERQDLKYNLVDIFAVNRGPPIELKLGTWEKGAGVVFENKRNKWDRRTDLMGALFGNTLWSNDKMADFVYSENGTIIGSKGWLQDILFHVIGSLNLTVETRKNILLSWYPEDYNKKLAKESGEVKCNFKY